MIIQHHLLHGAAKQHPQRIIVHAMAEQFSRATVLAVLQAAKRPIAKQIPLVVDAVDFLDWMGLSAHALVTSDADVIRCRGDTEGAWHAKGFNVNSLGVEVLLPGVHDYASFLRDIAEPWVPENALLAAARIVAEWRHRWTIPIQPGRIDRHSDVDPGRKQDPGQGFPWPRFLELIE